MQDETGNSRIIEGKVCEDMISALPDDLLVHILLLVPTKDAVATSILSKRWCSIWKILPRLDFNLDWSTEPISLSKSVYTCKSLKTLTLSNMILVDVPSKASLPSLVDLELDSVFYKDEESLGRLFSSCLVLENLFVFRRKDDDNVKTFSVKVSSLRYLWYTKPGDIGGSLAIDSPGLKYFNIFDMSGDACLMENMPLCLDMAKVECVSPPNDMLMRSLSSVMYLNLTWEKNTKDAFRAFNFSRLVECKLTPFYSSSWAESIMLLLHNSPKLKHLMIDSECIGKVMDSCPLWSCVPECLSSHLEIFECNEYGGMKEEIKLLKYILSNSKFLKTVTISLKSTNDSENETKKMINKVQQMYRVSESLQLFFSTQFRWRSMKKHPAFRQVMRL